MQKIVKICLGMLIFILSSVSVFASGYEGMAVYRDGVAMNLNWHAGICTKRDLDSYKPVIHIGGYGYNVSRAYYDGSEDSFLGDPDDDNEFKGVYWDNDYSVSYYDDEVEETAFDLLDYDISYDFFSMLSENSDCSGNIISPREIGTLRCDGLVEYCFEKNDIKVQDGYYSDPDNHDLEYYWDISRRVDARYHSIYYGPKGQAQDFLDLKSRNPW